MPMRTVTLVTRFLVSRVVMWEFYLQLHMQTVCVTSTFPCSVLVTQLVGAKRER